MLRRHCLVDTVRSGLYSYLAFTIYAMFIHHMYYYLLNTCLQINALFHFYYSKQYIQYLWNHQLDIMLIVFYNWNNYRNNWNNYIAIKYFIDVHWYCVIYFTLFSLLCTPYSEKRIKIKMKFKIQLNSIGHIFPCTVATVVSGYHVEQGRKQLCHPRMLCWKALPKVCSEHVDCFHGLKLLT